MKCPNCGIDLLMAERQGVEIDYCSQCCGIWLDRGELDKIVERSKAEHAAASFRTPRAAEASDYADSQVRRHPEDSQSRQEYEKGGRKKSGFLTNLLEGLGE